MLRPLDQRGLPMKLFILLSLFQISFAAPELRSAKALKTEVTGSSFTAQLAEGYHFNEKAPNGIQIKDQFIKPTTLLPRTLKIEKLPANALTGSAHVYVCDDKVTFCDMHTIALGKDMGAAVTPAATTTAGKVDSHGFLVNDFEAALKKAQIEKKMLLVDFGARWCPACLRMENEIFGNKDFKTNTKSFVKVKIDIDVFASAVLEQKYAIKGVPTILFLTTDGKEVARFYDYQPMSFINDILAEVKKYPEAIEDLEKKELTPELKKSLAKRYFFADQNTKAIALMKDMNPQPKEYWFARVGEAETHFTKDENKKSGYIETLKTAIKNDPESTRSIVWRSSLVRASSDKKVAVEANELTDKLLSNEAALSKATQTDILGEYTGLEGFYVAMMNAETADAAGVDAKKAWEKVITQGEKYKIDAKQPGAALRLLSATIKAENYEKALVLVDKMLQLKPQDGDLQRRKMRILVELKKYDEAVKMGEIALKNSYGVNEFFVVEPLAKAYVSLNKKEDAKKLITKYLSRNEINFSDLEGIKNKLEKLSQQL